MHVASVKEILPPDRTVARRKHSNNKVRVRHDHDHKQKKVFLFFSLAMLVCPSPSRVNTVLQLRTAAHYRTPHYASAVQCRGVTRHPEIPRVVHPAPHIQRSEMIRIQDPPDPPPGRPSVTILRANLPQSNAFSFFFLRRVRPHAGEGVVRVVPKAGRPYVFPTFFTHAHLLIN